MPSDSLPAGKQSKLVFIMHTLPIKLDNQGSETIGFSACSVDIEPATQGFMHAPANIEICGGEWFVTRAEKLV